jgi:hypothetical protein
MQAPLRCKLGSSHFLRRPEISRRDQEFGDSSRRSRLVLKGTLDGRRVGRGALWARNPPHGAEQPGTGPQTGSPGAAGTSEERSLPGTSLAPETSARLILCFQGIAPRFLESAGTSARATPVNHEPCCLS